jgi:hypothetical protein
MAVTAARIKVSSTEVALNTADAAASTLTVRNGSWVGSDIVVLGPSGVAVGSGFDLRGGEMAVIPLQANDVVYAIRGTPTDVLVSVLHT